MKPSLRQELDNGLVLSAESYAFEGAPEDSHTIRVSLRYKNDDSKELARKDISWSKTEPLPTKLEYSTQENNVKLTGPSTVVSIPIKIASFFASCSNNEGARVYNSFSSNPVACSDLTPILAAIRNACNAPENSKPWKALLKELKSFEGILLGCIPPPTQGQLIMSLGSLKDGQLLGDICAQLVNLSVLNRNYQDEFYNFCLEKKMTSILESVLSSGEPLSEISVVRFLRYATSLDDSKGLLFFKQLLKQRFTTAHICEGGEGFSSSEFSKIVSWSSKIMNENKESSEVVDETIALLSSVIDLQSSTLIWDSSCHEILLDLMKDVSEMTALCDAFNNFEVKHSLKTTNEQDFPRFRLRKITLQSRKVVW